MITKFKIYEGRKKIIYTKEYIDYWLNTTAYPKTGLFKLIKKFLRWKLELDIVCTPVSWHINKNGSIYIQSGGGSPAGSVSWTIKSDEIQEFIDFLNNPEVTMNTNKYNL